MSTQIGGEEYSHRDATARRLEVQVQVEVQVEVEDDIAAKEQVVLDLELRECDWAAM